jgi:hypothetical protein
MKEPMRGQMEKERSMGVMASQMIRGLRHRHEFARDAAVHYFKRISMDCSLQTPGARLVGRSIYPDKPIAPMGGTATRQSQSFGDRF